MKGAALDPELQTPGRAFSDADVLCRPRQVTALLDALAQHNWEVVSSFAYGSSFEHSATLRHPQWGAVDLHRWYPGLGGDPAVSFERLWATRRIREIAGVPCPVPDPTSQALLLLLHAARSGGASKAEADVHTVWDSATLAQRQDILHAVAEHQAEVGFSVIEGRLDDYADRPDYHLWRVASRGGTRLDEWVARFRATPTLRGRLQLVLRAPRVNREHLQLVRGRPLRRHELAVEFFARPLRGLREELGRVRARAGWHAGRS